MITNENKRRKWFEWGMVASAIGLLTFLFTYLINWGGSMEATYQTHLLKNGESKTIVICLEDASIDLNELSITPTFKNNSRVSLKHFSLSFETECTGVTLMPSAFVDTHNYNESKCLFSYRDKELAAHDDSKPPFSGIIINSSSGWCKIKSKASFEGKSDAFECYTYVYFYVVPNNEGLNYTDWKKKCEKCYIDCIKGSTFDLYYYTKNRQAECLFDVSLDSFGMSSTEKNDINQNKTGASLNTTTSGLSNVASFETKNSWGIVQCQISRIDSLLTYNLILDPKELVPGLYMVEARHKNNSKAKNDHKFSYQRFHIEENQSSARTSINYGKRKVPEIDQVAIYRQSVNDEVISVEQKKRSCVIKNKTDNIVVCFVTIDISNRSFFVYELDGGERRNLESLGVSPIEVFKTDRKADKSIWHLFK